MQREDRDTASHWYIVIDGSLTIWKRNYDQKKKGPGAPDINKTDIAERVSSIHGNTFTMLHYSMVLVHIKYYYCMLWTVPCVPCTEQNKYVDFLTGAIPSPSGGTVPQPVVYLPSLWHEVRKCLQTGMDELKDVQESMPAGASLVDLSHVASFLVCRYGRWPGGFEVTSGHDE